jgi:hypothetical protein
MAECPQGHGNPDGARFCRLCGTAIATTGSGMEFPLAQVAPGAPKISDSGPGSLPSVKGQPYAPTPPTPGSPGIDNASPWRGPPETGHSRQIVTIVIVAAVIVIVVGGAIAAIVLTQRSKSAGAGASQAPKTVGLQTAITDTVNAINYSEMFSEKTAAGSETGYLTYVAPDRLGGNIESGNRRTYVYISGNTEYQSLTVSNGSPTPHLVFYREQSQTAVTSLDPTQNYLRLGRLGDNVHRSGNSYSLSIARGGETGSLAYTVSGRYVSRFSVQAAGTTVGVTISEVGTAPSVGLPTGARVVAPPAGAGS